MDHPFLIHPPHHWANSVFSFQAFAGIDPADYLKKRKVLQTVVIDKHEASWWDLANDHEVTERLI
jgi:hypothetical protein